MYDTLHSPMPAGISEYENPFARVVVTKMLDDDGNEVASLPANSRTNGYTIDYKVVTEPLVANFRITSSDTKAKFDQIGDSLYQAMQVGGKGSSIEHSLFSAYRNVFDNILPNISSAGENTGNVLLLLVTDEDSSENLFRGHSGIATTSAVLSGRLTGLRTYYSSWVDKTICDADPSRCPDYPNPSQDDMRERINFKYVWVEVKAQCRKLIDGVEVYGEHEKRSYTFCTKHGADFCRQPVGALTGVYKTAAAAAIGCIGSASSAEIVGITNSSSAPIFPYDTSLNRLTSPFIYSGKNYANIADFYFKRGISARDLVRVAPAVRREGSSSVSRRHEHGYVNEEITQLSAGNANTRKGVPGALGRALIDRLKADERVASFYFGAIVNKTAPSGGQAGSKADSILSTVDYANQSGGVIGSGDSFSITESSFSFVGDVLDNFIQKAAVSSYLLPDKPGFRLHSLSILDPEENASGVQYTIDREKLAQNIALVEGRRITFNLEKLKQLLDLTLAEGESLASALEGYRIVPHYVRN